VEKNEKVRAVSRMQIFIQNHLDQEITLLDLAKSANYSPYHSAKMFKDVIGKSPFEYIRAFRLSKAAILLRDKKPKIIDVAFDFVFGSHEGFTRAFTKYFGINPKAYAKTTPPIRLFLPHRVAERTLTSKKEENQMTQNKTVFVQVVDRPARKLILKRGKEATHYFEYCEEVGCDVWGVLTSVKEALYEPIGMWLPPKLIFEDTSEYVQGVEVPFDYAGEVPEGFELIDLEPCKMMVFQGEPYDDERFEEEVGSVMDVVDKYDPTIYGFCWADEEAPRFQLEPQGYRGYIEARPVKLLKR